MRRDGVIATLGPICQIAWLTEHLDTTLGQWRGLAGIGPWTIYRNVTLEGVYRGEPASVTIDVGLSYHQDMQIEIIQPHGSGPSPYHHEDGRIRVGMHHVAWLVPDVPAATEAACATGLVPLFEAGNAATRVAYLQATEDPSLLFELIEARPAIVEGFEAGVAAARGWDGSSADVEYDFAAS